MHTWVTSWVLSLVDHYHSMEHFRANPTSSCLGWEGQFQSSVHMVYLSHSFRVHQRLASWEQKLFLLQGEDFFFPKSLVSSMGRGSQVPHKTLPLATDILGVFGSARSSSPSSTVSYTWAWTREESIFALDPAQNWQLRSTSVNPAHPNGFYVVTRSLSFFYKEKNGPSDIGVSQLHW